ncbi:MAG: hypothetical protein Rhims3KO_03370 [Hyphomicrobiales bacterium]
MRATGKKLQATLCLRPSLCLWQDTAANGHDRISAQHHGTTISFDIRKPALRCQGLGARQPQRKIARLLAALRRLIDKGWFQSIWNKANLLKQ